MKSLSVDLVADFGGTRVKYGVVRDGEILSQGVFDVLEREKLGVNLNLLRNGFIELLGEVEILLSDVNGVGLALPVVVSEDSGRVVKTFGKFDDSIDFDFQKWGEDEFGLSVRLENDARAALRGECDYGAGRGSKNVLMVTLGTGVGTAVLVGGEVFYGHDGSGGNLGGHLVVNRDGESCYCGSRGCVEAEVASWALPGRAEREDGFPESLLSDVDRIDYRVVFDLAGGGDKVAIRLRDRAIEMWTALILNFVQSFGLDRVVIGGGIMASAEIILPLLRENVDAGLIMSGEVDIVAAELGDGVAFFGV